MLGSTKLIALALLIVFGVALGMNHDAMQANFADLWTATRYPAPGVSAAPLPISGYSLVFAFGMASE